MQPFYIGEVSDKLFEQWRTGEQWPTDPVFFAVYMGMKYFPVI